MASIGEPFGGLPGEIRSQIWAYAFVEGYGKYTSRLDQEEPRFVATALTDLWNSLFKRDTLFDAGGAKVRSVIKQSCLMIASEMERIHAAYSKTRSTELTPPTLRDASVFETGYSSKSLRGEAGECWLELFHFLRSEMRLSFSEGFPVNVRELARWEQELKDRSLLWLWENVLKGLVRGRELPDFPEGAKKADIIRNWFNDPANAQAIEGDSITVKDFYPPGLMDLPDVLEKITHVTSLILLSTRIVKLPDDLSGLRNLTQFKIIGSLLAELPDSIGDLANLEVLSCTKGRLTTLPESLQRLTNLTHLTLKHNRLESLPESITTLNLLEELDVEGNRLQSLPENIGDMRALEALDIEGNAITTLPRSIRKLNLIQFYLSGNEMRWLPEVFGFLPLACTYKIGTLALPYSVLFHPSLIRDPNETGFVYWRNSALTQHNLEKEYSTSSSLAKLYQGCIRQAPRSRLEQAFDLLSQEKQEQIIRLHAIHFPLIGQGLFDSDRPAEGYYPYGFYRAVHESILEDLNYLPGRDRLRVYEQLGIDRLIDQKWNRLNMEGIHSFLIALTRYHRKTISNIPRLADALEGLKSNKRQKMEICFDLSQKVIKFFMENGGLLEALPKSFESLLSSISFPYAGLGTDMLKDAVRLKVHETWNIERLYAGYHRDFTPPSLLAELYQATLQKEVCQVDLKALFHRLPSDQQDQLVEAMKQAMGMYSQPKDRYILILQAALRIMIHKTFKDLGNKSKFKIYEEIRQLSGMGGVPVSTWWKDQEKLDPETIPLFFDTVEQCKELVPKNYPRLADLLASLPSAQLYLEPVATEVRDELLFKEVMLTLFGIQDHVMEREFSSWMASQNVLSNISSL